MKTSHFSCPCAVHGKRVGDFHAPNDEYCWLLRHPTFTRDLLKESDTHFPEIMWVPTKDAKIIHPPVEFWYTRGDGSIVVLIFEDSGEDDCARPHTMRKKYFLFDVWEKDSANALIHSQYSQGTYDFKTCTFSFDITAEGLKKPLPPTGELGNPATYVVTRQPETCPKKTTPLPGMSAPPSKRGTPPCNRSIQKPFSGRRGVILLLLLSLLGNFFLYSRLNKQDMEHQQEMAQEKEAHDNQMQTVYRNLKNVQRDLEDTENKLDDIKKKCRKTEEENSRLTFENKKLKAELEKASKKTTEALKDKLKSFLP